MTRPMDNVILLDRLDMRRIEKKGCTTHHSCDASLRENVLVDIGAVPYHHELGLRLLARRDAVELVFGHPRDPEFNNSATNNPS